MLPPLYGWMGAMAFLMRLLISEVNSWTCRKENDAAYSMRVYLGALAGLAIGWFIFPSKAGAPDALTILSPLALAFLAGYGVELLFSAMDKLVDAFSAKGKSIPNKPLEIQAYSHGRKR
jgi:hypothetical protein